MSVMTLNRDKWKKFKEDNNLSKSSFFNKADVGPTIDKFQKALDDCKKNPGEKSLMAAFSKAQDLQKAFNKFIELKETKQELKGPAKTQIETWHTELEEAVQGLAKLYKGAGQKPLQASDAKNMRERLDGMFNMN